MDIETQKVEFKSSWRDEFMKVICAFANSDGGVMFIGLDDRGNPVGVKKVKKLLEDIPNKIRNKMGIIPSVEVETRAGKEIIKITINQQTVPISYDGAYYVRSGSTNFELNGNELVDFILKRHGKGWDEFMEEDADIYDIDEDTLESFKRYAIDRIPSIALEKSPKAILEKLNLFSMGKIKRAAVLLFGKDPQKFFPSAYLKIGKFLSDTDILTSDVVTGNLFEQLDTALEMLRTKYLLSPIKYEGIHRREILEYPYKALRESIINALIHRNYLGSSTIQVRLYDDRVVFLNEGKLPPEVPVEKLKTEHLSKPRNTLLADIFYKAGFIESWGRGTLEILRYCLKQGLPEPDFFEEYGVFNTILYKAKPEEQTAGSPREKTGKGMGVTGEETERTGEKNREETRGTGEETGGTREETREEINATGEETERNIISLIAGNPSITASELARETGLTQKGVEWNIKKFKQGGILERIGPKKGGYWKILGK